MDLNRLRIFAQVLEKGSFTEAARALGLPKSSVSKSVRQLEDVFGVALIQRTSRSLRATENGDHLYTALRPALAVIHEAVRSAATRRSLPRGRVRLSCPPDLGDLVGDYVARFVLRHPGVRVDVSLSSRNVDLVADGFDLALRGGDLRDSSTLARVVLRTDFCLFASPSYLRKRGSPRRVCDLHDHTCIGVHASNGRASWRLSSAGRRQRTTVECAVTTDDMRFATRLVCQGAGIALLPSVTARPFVSARTLVRVLPSVAVEAVTLRLVAPSRGLEPVAVRLFREGLLEEPWVSAAHPT